MSIELPNLPDGFRALLGGLRYCQDAAVEIGKDTIIAEVEAYAKEAARLALEAAAKVCESQMTVTKASRLDVARACCAAAIRALGKDSP